MGGGGGAALAAAKGSATKNKAVSRSFFIIYTSVSFFFTEYIIRVIYGGSMTKSSLSDF